MIIDKDFADLLNNSDGDSINRKELENLLKRRGEIEIANLKAEAQMDDYWDMVELFENLRPIRGLDKIQVIKLCQILIENSFIKNDSFKFLFEPYFIKLNSADDIDNKIFNHHSKLYHNILWNDSIVSLLRLISQLQDKKHPNKQKYLIESSHNLVIISTYMNFKGKPTTSGSLKSQLARLKKKDDVNSDDRVLSMVEDYVDFLNG